MGFKRRRSEDSLLQDKPSDLLIITADSEQPIEAHSTVLGLFSKVVDDLPRASTTAGKTSWDLCQLVLEGQSSPVASAVVQSWLDLVYSRVDKRRQPPKVTSLSEAARSLLLFADAVGTCSPVMDALGEALAAQPMLTLPVTVNGGGGEGGAAAGGGGAAPPPQLQLQLALSGKIYFTRTDGAMYLFNIPYQPGESVEPSLQRPWGQGRAPRRRGGRAGGLAVLGGAAGAGAAGAAAARFPEGAACGPRPLPALSGHPKSAHPARAGVHAARAPGGGLCGRLTE